MKNPEFYLSVTGALLLSVSAASVISSSMNYRGVISAVAGISAFLLMNYAVRNSRRKGRDRFMKAVLTPASVLYELILFLGAVSTAVVTQNPSVGFLALAGIMFAEILQLEYSREFKKVFSQDLGRNGRVLILVASLGAFHLEEYYLFYGIGLLFLVSVYDSLRLIHGIRTEI